MKIKICSRSVLEKMSGSGFGPRTAVISITDVNEKEVRFYREPDFLLRLCFDDINSPFDMYGDARKLAVNLFSREQADQLAEFVFHCKDHIDILICDTAGRLQNKVNLMNELAKMKKVIAREIAGAPHNTWLVLDSTTGQNGLSQAELFNEVTDLSGIILTKTDGTSKGGIVIAIKDLIKTPVVFVTLGETIDDIRLFDLDLYLYSIIEDLENETK